MKNLIALITILFSSALARATPPSVGYVCKTESGLMVKWETAAYDIYDDEHPRPAVKAPRTDLQMTVNGELINFPSTSVSGTYDFVMARGNSDQFLIINMRQETGHGDGSNYNATMEFRVKTKSGLKRLMKTKADCFSFNDV